MTRQPANLGDIDPVPALRFTHNPIRTRPRQTPFAEVPIRER